MRILNTSFPVVFIFILFISSADNLYSQTFSKFGIKAGFITTGISTFNENSPYTLDQANLYVYDESEFFNFLSFDVGLYAEWFNTKEFSVSTELHYMIKGETDKADYIVPHLIGSNQGGNEWETGQISDKASFLSLQILPRYRAGISKEGGDDVYFFGGPVFNFMLENYTVATQPKYIEKIGFPGDIGIALGLGFEVDKKFMLELKLDYGLTGSYNFRYGNDKVTRTYNTFSVLTGLALSEFFK